MNSILYRKTVRTEGLECATHFVVDPGLVLSKEKHLRNALDPVFVLGICMERP